MVNAMGESPIMNFGFKNIVVHDEAGAASSVHIVPTEQFAHNLDQQGTCLCGPNLDYDIGSGAVVSRVVHFALERRFYQYDAEDVFG